MGERAISKTMSGFSVWEIRERNMHFNEVTKAQKE
jgi:hypothetical protein